MPVTLLGRRVRAAALATAGLGMFGAGSAMAQMKAGPPVARPYAKRP